MPIGAAIGAVGAIGSAVIGSNAASNASNVAQQTAAQNNALQTQIYNSNKGEMQPFVDQGTQAGSALNGFLGLGGDPAAHQAAFNDYLNSTGYQFDKSEGINSITSNKAAAGLLDSGSTLKSLDAFGTGLAQNFGQQYADNLGSVANRGESAASSLAGVGQNYANAFSSNNNTAAGITATADLQSAAQFNGLIGNAFSAFGGMRGMSSFGGGGGGSSGGGGNAFGGSWVGG